MWPTPFSVYFLYLLIGVHFGVYFLCPQRDIPMALSKWSHIIRLFSLWFGPAWGRFSVGTTNFTCMGRIGWIVGLHLKIIGFDINGATTFIHIIIIYSNLSIIFATCYLKKIREELNLECLKKKIWREFDGLERIKTLERFESFEGLVSGML